MSTQLPWSWLASTAVQVPALQAYRFMADGRKQSNWAMYSWNRKPVSDDTFVGESLFDGSELYVKPVGSEELLLVDYFCGTSLDSLVWMVEARIIPGDMVGLGPGACIINMTTWRDASHDPTDWALHQHVWLVEINLIKGLLERESQAAR